jgi:hypothetical protein
MCVYNRCIIMNECIFAVKICYYSKCGMVIKELNPHLQFGDHFWEFFLHEQDGFLYFPLFIL